MSPEQVRQMFIYEPDTGVLRWAVKKSRSIKIGDVAGVQSGNRLNVMIDYVNYKVHRLCWAHYYGEWPSLYIDHINGNGLDNRINNLREATQKQNMGNCSMHKDNSTGAKGVSISRGKYLVRVGGYHVGLYTSLEDAKDAYHAAAKKIYGEFARS